MKPEVARTWEMVLSCYQRAPVCLSSVDYVGVVAVCKDAIWTACAAIELAGLGDTSSTIAGLGMKWDPVLSAGVLLSRS
jgi:hypothetical protein